MEIDVLRAELERLFSLDELTVLSREILGLDPERIGGTVAKASFARALTERCREVEALDALLDAVLASRAREVDPKIKELGAKGWSADERLTAGDDLDGYRILRQLGEGSASVVYEATRDGDSFAVKVLRAEAARDKRALQRYFAVTRLVGRIEHEALPRSSGVGFAERAGGGAYYVAYEHTGGETLAARIARGGGMHMQEAKPILRVILSALSALHDKGIAHGNLKLENVILNLDDRDRPLQVVDAGVDRLRARSRTVNGHGEVFATLASPKTIAPEQIRGKPADPRSDLYAFGAIMYEVLTGKPVFSESSAVDYAVAHIMEEPERASSVAPRGWLSDPVDAFLLRLLNKDPSERPEDARAALIAFDAMDRSVSMRAVPGISDDDLAARIAAVRADPHDESIALRLESAVDEGADPAEVAQAFLSAADRLGDEPDAFADDGKKALLYRAARVYENANDKENAERVYTRIVEIDPGDEVAATSLEQLRKALGKFEEVVESLLARADAAGDPEAKSRALAEIGRIYAFDLKDRAQAAVAYTQAFCETPDNAALADEIERLAGSDHEIWNEAANMCSEMAASMPPERKNPLFVRLGRWYGEKLSRPDLAASCFQTVMAADPANAGALEGLSQVYRKAQQWAELAQLLLHRAKASLVPAASRDLRAEAAELFETKLSDHSRALDIYQQIAEEDPTHRAASEGVIRIYDQTGDHPGLVRMLERRAQGQHGEERWATLARVAQVYEEDLGDLAEASRRYEAVLEEDSLHAGALKGLDRIYLRTGKYRELLNVLDRQLSAAATPRQQIAVYERMAGVYEEEFLNHERAAEACTAILQIDPSHESALTGLERHYRALDRWEDLDATYERHWKAVGDDRRKVELLVARARVLSEQLGSPDRAAHAYEAVLALEPNHPVALEALAKLRESSGNAAAALAAIEALAAQATSPEGQAEQWIRAAKLLQSRGDLDGAIERLKRAVDAAPSSDAASAALREAYIARGDANAAVELLSRDVESAERPLQKAALLGKLARLLKDRVRDDERALAAAKQANRLDPANIDASIVLGDLAFDDERFLEAATHYEAPANRADSMDPQDAARVLVRYVDALYRLGQSEKAMAQSESLARISAGNADALARAARLTFDHGAPERAYELYRDLLDRFRDRLTSKQEVDALYHLGEAARRAGNPELAFGPLNEAADLDSSALEPLRALAKLYEERGDWQHVIKTKNRALDVAAGDERYELLVEVGEIYEGKLGDRNRAAKAFIVALDERPDDRKLLAKLMQLYSEEKDWGKLVDVVLKLADFVEDPLQKAKYLHTAGIVSARQLGETESALTYFERAVELDASNDKSLSEAVELRMSRGEYRDVERLLKLALERANRDGDETKMIEIFDRLGRLYKDRLGSTSEAVDAYEAAQTLDPENPQRNAILAALYGSDPARYLEKAAAAHRAILRENPNRADSYKLLRKLYTEVKRADSAWCLCQALTQLNLAEPDEERFFRRMRADGPAVARTQVGPEDFQKLLLHEDADPLLSQVFLLLEPAILAARAEPLAALGYGHEYAVDLASHPSMMGQTLYYAAGVLGITLPIAFVNPNDPGGLSFLHATEPSVVMGAWAMNPQLSPQTVAFTAARHLAYYRPGAYVRHLVPTGTGLKAWLFAAIKMIAPQFPVSPEIEGPVRENLAALERRVTGATRERLTSAVSKLIQSGSALDLKKWVAAVDLTADRCGFLLAHDLEVAGQIIKAMGEDASTVPLKERFRELILYSVSEPYFTLRRKLGIAIDS